MMTNIAAAFCFLYRSIEDWAGWWCYVFDNTLKEGTGINLWLKVNKLPRESLNAAAPISSSVDTVPPPRLLGRGVNKSERKAFIGHHKQPPHSNLEIREKWSYTGIILLSMDSVKRFLVNLSLDSYSLIMWLLSLLGWGSHLLQLLIIFNAIVISDFNFIPCTSPSI